MAVPASTTTGLAAGAFDCAADDPELGVAESDSPVGDELPHPPATARRTTPKQPTNILCRIALTFDDSSSIHEFANQRKRYDARHSHRSIALMAPAVSLD